MGYPDILRQTPIFCMNTQKSIKKGAYSKIYKFQLQRSFFNNIVLPIPTPSFTIATYGSPR